MNEFFHLKVPAVKAIHQVVLQKHGGGQGIRSEELLESAVHAPQANFGGALIIKDGVEIAAAYLYYLCLNHPFVDGNKRVALASCLVFLQKNELLPSTKLDPNAWEKLVLDVASSTLDRTQTTKRLRSLLNE